MRTTLALEDDLADRLAKVARDMGLPLKVVVNETLRRGLAEHEQSVPPFTYTPQNGVLRPGIDDRRLNELAWETSQYDAPRS